jgi:hypothetical protein
MGVMPDSPPDKAMAMALSPEQRRRQRIRSLAIGWGLAGLALLFFLVTLVRLGANVGSRPL